MVLDLIFLLRMEGISSLAFKSLSIFHAHTPHDSDLPAYPVEQAQMEKGGSTVLHVEDALLVVRESEENTNL